MAYDTIRAELQDDVCVVTMNRPHKLNAWTYQMGAEMSDAIAAANANDDVLGIVVTGEGRGFCAGADVSDVFSAQQTQSGGTDMSRGMSQAQSWIDLLRTSKPIVAAINGAAIGVGLTQVLAMDYLVAARGAKLSMRFIKMGLVPELGSSYYLFRRCAYGVASELMLTGRTVDADEALALGLVDRVVEPGDLLANAKATARAMGDNPQSALRLVKQLITANIIEADIDTVQKREGEAMRQCYTSPEHKEAISAFLEKRTPDFKRARRGG